MPVARLGPITVRGWAAIHDAMIVWLLRLGPTEHKLLIRMPHIVSDAWSMNIFTRELFRLYTAARDGTTPDGADLLAPRLHYVDFAAYQRRRRAELRRKMAEDREKGREGCELLEATALSFRRGREREVIGLAHTQAGYEGALLDNRIAAC